MINITILAIGELMADKAGWTGLGFSDGYGQGTTNADEASWLVLWQLGLPIDKRRKCKLPLLEQVADIIHRSTAHSHPSGCLLSLTREAWLLGVPLCR
jgi:ribosomal protein L3 glutamine methyltransferase